MVLTGKRHSELKGSVPIKKRPCLMDAPSLPRSAFLLAKTEMSRKQGTIQHSIINMSSSSENGESYEETGDGDVKSPFDTCPYVNCSSGPQYGNVTKLNPRLLEAVTRYSDSEPPEERNEQIKGCLNAPICSSDRNYNLTNGKRTVSRFPSFSLANNRAKLIPRQDFIARERCFDYILQSIDEVWSRYCNTTSTAENEVYDRLGSCKRATEAPGPSPNSSFCLPDGGGFGHHIRGTLSDDDISDSGYKSEVTNPTEYETDCDYRKVSNLPQSMKLQSLKDRLVKAKNDLEGGYDSNDWDCCMYFWRRWDMIKYSAVEMMEEDDDDDVIESVIDELEEGRCYNAS